MLGVRPLVLLGYISALLLMVYYLYSPSAAYPMQTVTKEEVIQAVTDFVVEHEIDSSLIEDRPLIETQANESIGRYVDREGWTTDEIEEASGRIPFYDIVIAYEKATFYIDPIHNKVIGAEGISFLIEEDTIDDWVQSTFDSNYTIEKEAFSELGGIARIYRSGNTVGDIKEKFRVDVVHGDTIIGLKRYGEVDGFPLKQGFNAGEIISFFVFFATLLFVAIAVTIQVIRNFSSNQIDVVFQPVIIGLVAGFGWVFTSYVALGKVEIFSLIFALVITYITCMILILTGRKEEYQAPFYRKVAVLKSAIINGFLLMLISTLLVEIFYYIAMRYGAWASPVMDYSIFLNAPMYALPFFALFMGISAAISEEAIFRRYLIPVFDRLGLLFSMLITSYLWAVGHVGYHMFPWHIRIIEFVVIVGPIFYFIYKRYGFLTAIFCHFFYNSFFGSIFLLGLDLKLGLLGLLLASSPFFILLFKKQTEEERTWT